MLSKCRSCKQPILFALTRKGRRIPLDPDPVENGNIRLTEVEGRKLPLARVVDGTENPGPRYRTHFASCPDADRFRR